MTPTLEKFISAKDKHFKEVCTEGATRTHLKGRLGIALYEEGIANGDIEERANEEGRIMAFKSTH
jgi:hypothetical protein